MSGIKLKGKPRRQDVKRAMAFKAIISILLSNALLFFLLTGESGQEGRDGLETEGIQASSRAELPVHEGFEKLLLPVEVFVPLSPGKQEYPVGLYDGEHRLVVPLAYLHPDFKKASLSEMMEAGAPLMVAEVPQGQLKALLKIVATNSGQGKVLAFPYQEGAKLAPAPALPDPTPTKTPIKMKRRTSPREIVF